MFTCCPSCLASRWANFLLRASPRYSHCCSSQVTHIIIAVSRPVIAILYEFVKIPGPGMFIHFSFYSHNPSLVVLTGAEDITNKSRVNVYLDIILIIPPPAWSAGGLILIYAVREHGAGEQGDCSLSLWWSQNINQWFSVCRPHSACSVLLDIELWRAQSRWKNDGLEKTRQCNSEFSNTLHKNWLHDKFCFVLCSNKTKSLLTILTITQRITDYKTSLLGGKMEYSIVFKTTAIFLPPFIMFYYYCYE